MITYFKKTAVDTEYYERYLKSRLPEEIMDMHIHLNLPDHVSNVSSEKIKMDWAMQAGYMLPYEDAKFYLDALFPEQKIKLAACPLPIADADIVGNNEYISSLLKSEKIKYGFMSTRPEWDYDYLERVFEKTNYVGLKPYPDLVSGSKGAEISIFDFITREQFAFANKYHKCVLLHLPRADRFADDHNIAELKQIADAFPDVKVIIAHLGRCFNQIFFEQALTKMGSYFNWFWYDTAAVSNPNVLKLAFENVLPEKIMFGQDLHIFLWHGFRLWTKTRYVNICREELPWKKVIDDEKTQVGYTFYLYEQLKNILDALDELCLDETFKSNYFKYNAEKLFQICI